ncbi:MAG: hypothetical protein QM638_02700 [Nocardioides sp.]|uniref:hypothetical protein n=1 Tax=Nocardioides sp. TaxID=35761 RepID=UPI0039E25242
MTADLRPRALLDLAVDVVGLSYGGDMVERTNAQVSRRSPPPAGGPRFGFEAELVAKSDLLA